jgi:hypothetical protein
MTKLEIALAGIVVALLLFVGWSFWERHEGAVSCEDKDKSAVASQEAHNATVLVNQNQAIASEKQAYEDALLQPIAAPVVRLCSAPSPVPQAPPAARGTHGNASVPIPSPEAVVSGPDVGLPLVRIGHDADNQIAGLQDYIKRVCLSQ